VHEWYSFEKKNSLRNIFGTYCLLLKRMQPTFTARVGSLNTRNECRRKTHTAKNTSLYHCMICLPLVAVCWVFRL